MDVAGFAKMQVVQGFRQRRLKKTKRLNILKETERCCILKQNSALSTLICSFLHDCYFSQAAATRGGTFL